MFRMKKKVFDKDHPEKMIKNSGTYFVLFLSLGAMTFFGVCTPRNQLSGLGGIAGKVGSEEISNAEFSRAYQNYSERLRKQYGEQYDPRAFRVASSVLNQLVDGRILYLKAKELGLNVGEEEILRLISEASLFRDEKGNFSDEQFRNYLRANRYSESTFYEEIKRNMMAQKLREFVAQSVYVSSKASALEYRLKETKVNLDFVKIDTSKLKMNISKDDVQKLMADPASEDKFKIYYDSHKPEYVTAPQVRAQHILISFQEAKTPPANLTTKRTKAEALTLAKDLIAQAKAPNADFSKLAKEKTDEASGQKSGGELGFFTKEDMVPAFSEAAFGMKNNEISSEPVETDFGFHIIKVLEHKEAKNVTLEQAKEEIANKILEREKAPVFAKDFTQTLLAALQKNQPIDDQLKSNGLAWEQTGLFSINASYIPKIGSSQDVKEAILKLKVKGELYDQVLAVGKNLFLIKLQEKEAAKVDDLDDEKKRQMAMASAFSEGYALYGEFEKDARREYEEKKSIYRNPEYLALDDGDASQ